MLSQNSQPDFPAALNPILLGRMGNRTAYADAGRWTGLPSGLDSHWPAVQAAEDALPLLGVSAGACAYFRVICRYTRSQDWQPDSEPIVYLTVSRLAELLGRSTRQIQSYERELNAAGVLIWKSSGNYRRYGRRDRDGRILVGYGVSLAPVAVRYEELQQLVEAHRARQADRAQELRRVRSLRRALIAILSDDVSEFGDADLEVGAELMSATMPRAVPRLTLEELRTLRGRLEEYLWTATQSEDTAQETAKKADETTDRDEENFAHINTHNTSPSKAVSSNAMHMKKRTLPNGNEIKFSAETANAVNRSEKERAAALGVKQHNKPLDAQSIGSGIEHIQLDQVLSILGEAGQFFLSRHCGDRDPGWPDLVDAAKSIAPMIGISPAAVSEADTIVGRQAAAVAILLIERKFGDGVVRSPGGFLRGMIGKAKSGDLHLHRTVFGLVGQSKNAEN